jgi:hypothetical protein
MIAVSNVNSARAHPENIDHEVGNDDQNRQPETMQIEPSAPNPYRRETETHQLNNRRGRNDNTVSNQQPHPSLPVAEMRSNDAPQNDSIPVGNVIGLVNSHREDQTAQEDTITRMNMAEARRDSQARNRLARAIHPESLRPSEWAASNANANQDTLNRTRVSVQWQSPQIEALRDVAATYPLSSDDHLNIWVHLNAYIVFNNRRTGGSPESNVMIRRILDNYENFRWPMLSPLSSYNRWDVISSVAPLMVSIHADVRHAMFVSHIWITCSMQDLQNAVTNDNSGRSFHRKYKNMKHFSLSADTAYPLINKEIVSKSALAKIQASTICPVVALELMRSWILRCYHYHINALINQVNTYVDPTRLQDILNTPGEFHQWAIEVVPEAIFNPPAPRNIMHIWESIVKAQESRLKQQSLQEVLEIESDIPALGDQVEQEQDEDDEAATSLTGIQGQDHGPTAVVAELIPEDQVAQLLSQVPQKMPQIQVLTETELNNAAIASALETSEQEGREIVLAGMYGGPSSAEGFKVTEYIELDASTIAPPEAYPQMSENPYQDAIDCYVKENYALAKKDIRIRMHLLSNDQIKILAMKPGKLEYLIQMMQLRKYTPISKMITRCNGWYQVPIHDPALLFPAGKDFTSLIQVSTDNADTFIHELRVFGEIFLPEHRFQVGAARQLMPNLTEQPFQEGGGNKVI